MLIPILAFALISALALRITYVWAYNAGLDIGIKFGTAIALAMVSDENVLSLGKALDGNPKPPSLPPEAP